ncbi:MAG: hypothetical protein HZB86_09980 [Deltaproteobacteria bacterium]|nr:hypothetical protein [Deltaproteobacteria bacterium]
MPSENNKHRSRPGRIVSKKTDSTVRWIDPFTHFPGPSHVHTWGHYDHNPHQDAYHTDSHDDSFGDVHGDHGHDDERHDDQAHDDVHNDYHYDLHQDHEDHHDHFDVHDDVHDDVDHADDAMPHDDQGGGPVHFDAVHSDLSHHDHQHVDFSHLDSGHFDVIDQPPLRDFLPVITRLELLVTALQGNLSSGEEQLAKVFGQQMRLASAEMGRVVQEVADQMKKLERRIVLLENQVNKPDVGKPE